MHYNRIAIYGHRGWAASAIVKALVDSGAPIKVLHRPDSDISMLPASIRTVDVDLTATEEVTKALQDIDIVMYTASFQPSTSH